MGMRATFGRIDTNGNVKATSVQWSTMFDENLCNAVGSIDGDVHADLVKARMDCVRNIFSHITTKYDHVSCVDSVDAMSSREYQSEEILEGTKLCVIGGCARDSFDDDENDTLTNVLANMVDKRDYEEIFTYHLDGNSIGAVYDERVPEIVTFFWRDYDKDGNYFINHEAMNIANMSAGDRCVGFQRRNNG